MAEYTVTVKEPGKRAKKLTSVGGLDPADIAKAVVGLHWAFADPTGPHRMTHYDIVMRGKSLPARAFRVAITHEIVEITPPSAPTRLGAKPARKATKPRRKAK
jgi:hypothetical protein